MKHYHSRLDTGELSILGSVIKTAPDTPILRPNVPCVDRKWEGGIGLRPSNRCGLQQNNQRTISHIITSKHPLPLPTNLF